MRKGGTKGQPARVAVRAASIFSQYSKKSLLNCRSCRGSLSRPSSKSYGLSRMASPRLCRPGRLQLGVISMRSVSSNRTGGSSHDYKEIREAKFGRGFGEPFSSPTRTARHSHRAPDRRDLRIWLPEPGSVRHQAESLPVGDLVCFRAGRVGSSNFVQGWFATDTLRDKEKFPLESQYLLMCGAASGMRNDPSSS